MSSKPVKIPSPRTPPTIFATSTPAKNSRPALDTSSCFACGRLSCSKIFSCEDFRSMSPNDRVRRAKEKKCCLNCLRRDHVIESCPSKRSCFDEGCSGRPKHHTLLHGADIFANQLPITPSTSHLDSVRRDAPHNIYTSTKRGGGGGGGRERAGYPFSMLEDPSASGVVVQAICPFCFKVPSPFT